MAPRPDHVQPAAIVLLLTKGLVHDYWRVDCQTRSNKRPAEIPTYATAGNL